MASIFVIYLYITFLAFIYGKLALKLLKAEITSFPELPLAAGLCFLTVYAQFFSLIHKVGLLANLILAAGAVLLLIRNRNCLRQNFSVRTLLIFLGLLVVFSYASSRGIMHYDSDLYHAQSIRWIEEYGAVKGLANLHTRLGYNSASFALTALFSFAFLGKGSFHVCAGYFAVLTAFACFDNFHFFRKHRICAADFARLGALYYLFIIFDEIVSPASDYFSMLLVFYLSIRLLDAAEGEITVNELIPFAFLSVYLVSIKLSAAPMIILAVLPGALLIRQRDFKRLAGCLLTGTVIIAPYLIRNVILSGWLLYPSVFPDLFDVPWKLPREEAVYDANEIGSYGRGLSGAVQEKVPLSAWIGPWFQKAGAAEKLMIILSFACLLAGLMLAAVYLLIRIRKKKAAVFWEFATGKCARISLISGLMLSFTLWFYSAPMIRYGYSFLILIPLISIGTAAEAVLTKCSERCRFTAARAFSAAAVLFLLFKTTTLIREQQFYVERPYYLTQQDYGSYSVLEAQIDGVTIYYPEAGDQAGYQPFPAAAAYPQVELLGENVGDGFKRKPSADDISR